MRVQKSAEKGDRFEREKPQNGEKEVKSSNFQRFLFQNTGEGKIHTPRFYKCRCGKEKSILRVFTNVGVNFVVKRKMSVIFHIYGY